MIDGQLDFSTRGDRVEETDTLYEATVARIAAVGHGQVVEGALFGAATSETNSYHENIVPVVGANLRHTSKMGLGPKGRIF